MPSVDRLASHPAVLKDIFESNLPVISIVERRRVGRKSLERLLIEAQRQRDKIAGRARDGMARSKKRGAKLGNRKNFDVAQRNGAVANSARADRKTQELADFIERIPGWDQMTLGEKLELVNRAGPHNLVSEKRSEHRAWTMGSIRKPLKRAEEEVALRKELANEPVVLAPNWSWDSADERPLVRKEADAIVDDAADERMSLADAYRHNPDFGRF